MRCYELLDGQLGKSGGKSVLRGELCAVDWHFYSWVLEHEFTGLSVDKFAMLKECLAGLKERNKVEVRMRRFQKGERLLPEGEN